MSTVAKNGTRLPAVSVVIAAFADERWTQLCDAIESVREQTAPALETVVVIDHNPALLARARREFTDCTVIANTGARGASGARNTGAASCHGEIIAFLDDDARSSACWLAALLCHFSRADIVGVGGRIDPLWAASRPRWFPVEFGWAVGFSYQGMPERAPAGPQRVGRQHGHPLFGVRGRRRFPRGLRQGRRRGAARGHRPVPAGGRRPGDLVLRADRRASGTGYPGSAPPSATSPAAASTRGRARRRWRRWTGRGQAPPPSAATPTGSSRTRVLRGLQDAAQGDAWGAARAAAIAVGFATTAAGFAAGWLTGIGLPLLGTLHGRQAGAIEHANAARPAAIASTVVRVR